MGKQPKRTRGPFRQEFYCGAFIVGVFKIIIVDFWPGICDLTVAKSDMLCCERHLAGWS